MLMGFGATHNFHFFVFCGNLKIMSITYQPKKRKRSRTHGFRARSRTPGGRNTLRRRRVKGRVRLSV